MSSDDDADSPLPPHQPSLRELKQAASQFEVIIGVAPPLTPSSTPSAPPAASAASSQPAAASNGANGSEPCTHFVPHSWKYNKCRRCERPQTMHLTTCGLDPDVLFDHPELELPPHLRPGASPDGIIPQHEVVVPAPIATIVKSSSSQENLSCTHFVPHSWKYNKCRICTRPEKDHATSAGLDPDILLEQPELELPPHLRPSSKLSPPAETVAIPPSAPAAPPQPMSSSSTEILSSSTPAIPASVAVVTTTQLPHSHSADLPPLSNSTSSSSSSSVTSSPSSLLATAPAVVDATVSSTSSTSASSAASSSSASSSTAIPSSTSASSLAPPPPDVPPIDPTLAVGSSSSSSASTSSSSSASASSTHMPPSSVPMSPNSTIAVSPGGTLCTIFVPHAWKYNHCRHCDRPERLHAFSIGLDPDALDDRPDLLVSPHARSPDVTAPPTVLASSTLAHHHAASSSAFSHTLRNGAAAGHHLHSASVPPSSTIPSSRSGEFKRPALVVRTTPTTSTKSLNGSIKRQQNGGAIHSLDADDHDHKSNDTKNNDNDNDDSDQPTFQLYNPHNRSGGQRPLSRAERNEISRARGLDDMDPYSNGIHPPPSPPHVRLDVDGLRKKARQGDLLAMMDLGDCYWEGRGVQLDYTTAVDWYTRASDAGHRRGQHSLALAYEMGRGLGGAAPDYDKALALYERAAAQGYTAALRAMINLYRDGKGTRASDPKQAFHWFVNTANTTHSSLAQYYVGLRYHEGKGVTANDVQAVTWWIKSVESGNHSSALSLASLYIERNMTARQVIHIWAQGLTLPYESNKLHTPCQTCKCNDHVPPPVRTWNTPFDTYGDMKHTLADVIRDRRSAVLQSSLERAGESKRRVDAGLPRLAYEPRGPQGLMSEEEVIHIGVQLASEMTQASSQTSGTIAQPTFAMTDLEMYLPDGWPWKLLWSMDGLSELPSVLTDLVVSYLSPTDVSTDGLYGILISCQLRVARHAIKAHWRQAPEPPSWELSLSLGRCLRSMCRAAPMADIDDQIATRESWPPLLSYVYSPLLRGVISHLCHPQRELRLSVAKALQVMDRMKRNRISAMINSTPATKPTEMCHLCDHKHEVARPRVKGDAIKQVLRCTHCSSRFGLVTHRRNWCRWCGSVICSDCSVKPTSLNGVKRLCWMCALAVIPR